MANDSKITFMCDEAMSDLLAKVSFDSDCNKSEVIRACILLGIDTVAQYDQIICQAVIINNQ